MRSQTPLVLLFLLALAGHLIVVPAGAADAEEGDATEKRATLPFREKSDGPHRLEPVENGVAKAAVPLVPVSGGDVKSKGEIRLENGVITFLEEENAGLVFEPIDPVVQLGSSGLAVGLSFGVDFAAHDWLNRFGSYRFEADVIVDEASVGKLKLDLVYPQTRLTLPDSVFIEQVLDFGEWTPEAKSFPLKVRLASGPPPDSLTILQKGQAQRNGKPVEGELGTEAISREDFEGKNAEATLNLSKRFALGSSTGKLLVDSPQTAVVEVPFTVLTRHTHWLLAFIALAGAVVGFIVRLLLPNLIFGESLKTKAGRLLSNVINDRARFGAGDAELKDDLTEIQGAINDEILKLKQSPQKEDLTKVETALTSLQERYNTALEEATGRRTAVKGDIAKFRAALTSDIFLPASIREICETELTDLRTVVTELENRRTDSAKILLGRSTRKALTVFRGAGAKWAGEFIQRVDTKLATISLPQRLVDSVDLKRDEFNTSRPSSLASGTGDSIQDIESTLKAINVCTQSGQAILMLVQHGTADIATNVSRAFAAAVASGQEIKKPESIEALKISSSQLQAYKLEPLVSDPISGLTEFLDALEAGLAQAKAAIIAEARVAEVKNSAATLIIAGDYRKAAKQVIAALPMKPSPAKGANAKSRSTTGSQSHQGMDFEESNRFINATTVEPVIEIPGVPRAFSPAQSAIRFAERAEANRLKLESIRAVLSIAIAASIACFTFWDGFIGSANELFKIFFWAFFLDLGFLVSIDALKDKLPE